MMRSTSLLSAALSLLTLLSTACGSVDNGAAEPGASTGPVWSDPVEIGEGGAPSDVESESNVATSISEDLSLGKLWSLELPSGSGNTPKTISPASIAAGYADSPYYYKGADGGQIFMNPQHGTTWAQSLHPRTEMREYFASGAAAAWSPGGTNSMTVTGRVIKVGGGSSGDVTVAQVFNGTQGITLAELQYSSGAGGFKLFYEEARGQGSSVDLHAPIALGKTYTFALALSANKLSVTVNGKVVYTHAPSSSTLKNQFFFKFGAYDQTATAGTLTSAVYTQLENYAVTVVHK